MSLKQVPPKAPSTGVLFELKYIYNTHLSSKTELFKIFNSFIFTNTHKNIYNQYLLHSILQYFIIHKQSLIDDDIYYNQYL